MAALSYVENGHGISLSDFPNHYIMVFDLTSIQGATHDFDSSRINKLFIICGTQVRCSVATQHWNFTSRGEMFNSLYQFFAKRFQKRSSYNLMD